MRCDYITKRVAKLKKNVATPNAVKDAEKLDHSYTADQNVKWYRYSEKGDSSFSFLQN